jgi:integrase
MDNTNSTSNYKPNQGIQSLSRSSSKKRQRTFELYSAWADDCGLSALPPTDAAIARYIREHTDLLAFATLRHRVSVIRQCARAAGYDWPIDDLLTRRALANARKETGVALAEPLLERDLRDLSEALKSGSDWRNARDLALIQAGAGAGLDVVELIHLSAADVSLDDIGATLDVGARPWIAPPRLLRAAASEHCPVRALAVWLTIRERVPSLFYEIDEAGQSVTLTPSDVKTIVKKRMREIGRDDRRYGHGSLRAAFIFSRPMPRALIELAGETW